MLNVYEEKPRLAPVLICRIRPRDARIMLANDSFCTFMGRSREHLIGKSLFKIISPQDKLRVNHCLDNLNRHNPFLTCVHTFKTPSGIQKIRWTHQALVNDTGNIVEIQSMGIDSETPEKTSDLDKASEEKYWQLIENSNEFIIVVQEGLIRYMNEKARSLPGLSAGDFIGRPFINHIHPEDRHTVLDFHMRRHAGETIPHTYTFRFCSSNCDMRWLEISAVVIEFEGRPATLNFLTDITERMRFEDELEQSKEKNKLIVENASDIIFIVDTNLRIIDISPRVEQVLGYRREELVNKTIREINTLKPEYMTKAYSEGERVLSGEQIRSSIYEFTSRDGNDIVAEISGAPMIHENKVESIICIARDITERKRIEDSLRESEKKHRETLEQIDDGYYEVDLKGNFTFFNSSMCKILRFSPEELMGMNNRSFMSELNAHRVFCTFNQVYRSGIASKSLDWELIRKDGSKCFVETSVSLMHDPKGAPVGFRGISRDVTEQKSLEYQLYQSQKMEAIGTLAGGIAHDFNNILSGIMGYTELALMEIPEGSPLQTKMDQVLKAGNRAKELIKQILTFSRRTEYENRPIKIKTVVDEALMMIRATLPASIEIIKAIEADDAIIEADPTQIHQIVLNLCTNAYHAVRETSGFIEVKLRQINADDADFMQNTNLKKGSYVELAIIDTGCGISPDAMARIFDPYYSSKPKGEGTGLGLAIVHGIVKSIGGDIKVKSIYGRGSSFHVYLPRINEAVTQVLNNPGIIPSGKEHILIIDDERSIIEITSQMLQHLGYKVTAYQGSMDALDNFRSSYFDFDLVISDLTMPKMNGDQLAERLLLIRPDIPIIICTGFSDTIPQEMVRRIGIREVLVKPIALHDLAKIIRKVLDSAGPEVEPSFNQIAG